METWMRLDHLILRPLFIYKYARDTRLLQKAFFETYDQDGRELEEVFGRADAGGDAKQAPNTTAGGANELMRKMSLLKRKRTVLRAPSKEFELKSMSTMINPDDDLDDKYGRA